MSNIEIEHGCIVGEGLGTSLERPDVRNKVARATRQARRLTKKLQGPMPPLERDAVKSSRDAALGSAAFWRRYL